MSHRERCMIGGALSQLLIHLGILKDPSKSSSSSHHNHPQPPATENRSHNTPALRPSSREPAFINLCKQGFPKESIYASKIPSATPNRTNEAADSGKVPILSGFRVRVSSTAPSSASKGTPSVPVVCECTPGSGGVQGLQWYSENLMMDEDGDIAQEFLDEVLLHAASPLQRSRRNFKIIVKTIPAKLKGPVCTFDGNVVQCMESNAGSAFIHLHHSNSIE